MTESWGRDTVYSEDKGYDTIINLTRFALYSLPGALVLLFTSLGAVAVLSFLGLSGRRSRRSD